MPASKRNEYWLFDPLSSAPVYIRYGTLSSMVADMRALAKRGGYLVVWEDEVKG